MSLYFLTSWVQGEALVKFEVIWFDVGQFQTHWRGDRGSLPIPGWLMPTVEKFPRSHKFTVGDRIGIAALDVLDMLIEATYTRDRLQPLRQANLGIEKLRFLLRLAADLRLLDRRRYEHAARVLDETGRLIGGWTKAQLAASSKTIAIANATTA